MQTMYSFLKAIDPNLALRSNDHRTGYVSDLVFKHFDATLMLLLPIGNMKDTFSWADLAAKHHYSLVEVSRNPQLLETIDTGSKLHFAEGVINSEVYLSQLTATLADFSEYDSWHGIFWSGYAVCAEQAHLIGPVDSFLRPEEYTLREFSSRKLTSALNSCLPSLLFNSSISCVLTQPIYSDRFYVSCHKRIALALSDKLPDVLPVTAEDSLPNF